MAVSTPKWRKSRAEDDIRIMCVGLTVVDLITTIERYPEEDSDQRGLGFRKQRGGNASNICTVLSHLNTPCEYLGILPPASDPEYRHLEIWKSHGDEVKIADLAPSGYAVMSFLHPSRGDGIAVILRTSLSSHLSVKWLKEDFKQHGIMTQGCLSSDRPCPVATVVVSRHTGSRTIIFCDNGHPELSHQQFRHAVGDDHLSHFTWIHFELRPNIQDYLQMLETVAEYQNSMAAGVLAFGKTQATAKLHVSVEIEKPDLMNPDRVMLLADVVFISKDWARSQGWTDMCSAVKLASQLCKPHCIVVCPWAEEGAAAWCNGEVLTAAANPPGDVVDTLGAGDTFVAGFLHARAHHMAVNSALDFACSLAAAKCTMEGFEGIKHFASLNASLSESTFM